MGDKSERISIGDLVVRQSHDADVLFRVVDIVDAGNGQRKAVLKGLDLRLYADSPIEDLATLDFREINKLRQPLIQRGAQAVRECHSRRMQRKEGNRTGKEKSPEEDCPFFEIPGRVLHLDGDKEYVQTCKQTYSQLYVEAQCEFIPEVDQPTVVEEKLRAFAPDILVLTGHDGYISKTKDFHNMDAYRTSRYFAEAVRRARLVNPNRDELVIIAGACQSYYEALLKAGANFASSPNRVLIHALDPVFVAEKIAFTPIKDIVALKEVVAASVTGTTGVGGIESHGTFRMGFPKTPYATS